MIAPEILELICCPETHQPLRYADAPTLDRLNARIAASQLKNISGTVVTEKIEAALIRKDNQRAYLVRDNIPALLIGEAVDLANEAS